MDALIAFFDALGLLLRVAAAPFTIGYCIVGAGLAWWLGGNANIVATGGVLGLGGGLWLDLGASPAAGRFRKPLGYALVAFVATFAARVVIGI